MSDEEPMVGTIDAEVDREQAVRAASAAAEEELSKGASLSMDASEGNDEERPSDASKR